MVNDAPAPRAIRSFVMRGGRATAAQQRALNELWPRYGLDFTDAPVDLDALYGRKAPRTVEIGFGNGDYLIAQADSHVGRDYLGIEVHPPGVGHVLLQAEAAELSNLRVSRHDAIEVLTVQIAAASLDEIVVLFPDPWHKKRHNKRRLVNPAFATLAASRLAPGGRLRLATDWEPYAQQMIEVLDAEPAFTNLAGKGVFSPRDAERDPTRFERRGHRLGHGVWDLTYT
ncbi:MAG: tRNA (guanosine(46)-N7)-methyltransferase TrmB, partial [Steroidobacteraceae bacterium]